MDLLQELYELCKIHKVTWHKVKGHADNPYNNRCDEIAVAETEKYKNMAEEIPYDEKRDEFYSGDLTETVTHKETIFEGKVFTVEKLKVTLPDGSPAMREVIRHNGGAAVIAVDDERNVYMVKQYRIATGGEMWEIPAGKVEPGEDPKLCAARELTEETGFRSSLAIAMEACSDKVKALDKGANK